jgi:hypothetical protein
MTPCDQYSAELFVKASTINEIKALIEEFLSD